MAAKKDEPVDLNVKEPKDGGYCKLAYRVENLKRASHVDWRLEKRDEDYYAVFEATVNEQGYYRESKPMTQEVYDVIKEDKDERKVEKDRYKVKLLKKKNIELKSYFY
ncbi:uncharacterized protein LOC121368192 [Gigantopelta aegis]|uniref:uncharacterized protein LOC121368192 n=1 Tax=Gigantopelta aegis TaxID=1735272 RepID=UPI001B887E87|nr:uncharacterized protein LOC121368192 [Gigantopelta aegis]XP_041348766.1 uncharacterized protein LOC121368192 [Gigantopelta aegis]